MESRSKLRVVLVTSQVTFVPKNYLDLIEGFVSGAGDYLAGVVFLKNLDLGVAKQILGLRYLGAKHVQRQLLKNVASLPFRLRERFLDQNQIPHASFRSINDDDAYKWCQSLSPDLIVNARTRCIYKKRILKLPRLSCLNIHHGLLPEHRGTMSDLYALSEQREAGFSIHEMTSKIDDGRIFVRQRVSDGRQLNYLNYLKGAACLEGQVLADFVKKVSDSGCLPDGDENKSTNLVYTKNPTRQQVQSFLKKGMVL